MKFLASVVAVMVFAPRADAMGLYVNFDVIAWNADSTSALVTRDTSGSAMAGSSHDYIVVTAGETAPIITKFTDLADPDKSTEHVDKATCVKAAAAFEKVLAAKHFKGVSIKSDQCSSAKRAVVVVSPDAAQLAALSWLSTPAKRAASARETAGWAADKAAGSGNDVAALTDKLILVFSGGNGDSSWMAHVATYVGGKAQIADLRGMK